MPLRAVILDFDGTLADSLGLALAVYNDCAPALGIPRITAADLARGRTKPPQEIVRELGIPLWKLPRVMHAVRAGMARRVAEVRLFPGVPEMLATLRAGGLRCGVLTSNSEDNVLTVLGAAGIPAPEPRSCGVSLSGKGARLRRLLRGAGLSPDEVCLVGDEVRDIAAAREAGTHAAFVNWGYGDASGIVSAPADHVATTPAELTVWLLSQR